MSGIRRSLSEDDGQNKNRVHSSTSSYKSNLFTASASDLLYPGNNYVDSRSRNRTRKKNKKKGRSLSPVRGSHTSRTVDVPTRSSEISRLSDGSTFVDPESAMFQPEEEPDVTKYADSKYVRSTSKSEEAVPKPKQSKDEESPMVCDEFKDSIADAESRAVHAEMQQNFSNFSKFSEPYSRKRGRYFVCWSTCACLMLAACIAGLFIFLIIHDIGGQSSATAMARERAKHSFPTSPPTEAPTLAPTEQSKNDGEEEEKVEEENSRTNEEGGGEVETESSNENSENIPDHIPHAPGHLTALCMGRSTNSLDECHDYCFKATCCWEDNIVSCADEFVHRCPSYASACSVLNDVSTREEEENMVSTGLLDGSSGVLSGNGNNVPPAPKDLAEKCSLDQLTTDDEKKEVDYEAFGNCQKLCDRGGCCWKPTTDQCTENPDCPSYVETCAVLVDLL